MIKLFAYIIIFSLFITSCSKGEKQGMDNHQTHNQKEGTQQDALEPANQLVLSSAETIHPDSMTINQTIHSSGYIALDESRNNKIAIRASGRIEKLYIKSEYQLVRKGDKLLELYSPELNTYQEEFIHHLETNSDLNLVEASKHKLLLLGFTLSQINEIELEHKPLKTITIYSSYDGYIFYDLEGQQNNLINSSSNTSQGMGAMNSGPQINQPMSNNNTQSGSRIREGGYVTTGQTLFIINDCKVVWAIMSLDANLNSIIKLNSPVQVLTPEPVKAIVNFLEPVFNTGQKFIQARIYLKNESQKIKINSPVNYEIELAGKYLLIPSSAVLSLGNRNFVWLKKESRQNKGNILEAKEITTGNQMNGYIEVVTGLTIQDEIAKDAAYLIDSESLINSD